MGGSAVHSRLGLRGKMGFKFFRRQQPDGAVTDAFRGPGISEADHAAFHHIVSRARELFGAAVETDSIVVGSGSLPVVSVGALSVIGEQWIVIDTHDHNNLLYPSRLELDWETGVAEAIAVLEAYQTRQLLAPTPGDVLTARVIALVGSAGEVTVSMVQAEFSHIISVRPHRRGALPFNLNVTTGFVVVLESPHLGWWTFGGDYDNDGTQEAFRVVEQLVLRGGTVHSTRGRSELLGAGGTSISGPHRDGVQTRHPKTVEFLPYRAP
jgi:hypothetical protein